MATEITLEMARSLLPPRPEGGHKGSFGHLFILAGSRGFTGAAKLAGRAAYRAGAGLVTVGVPDPVLEAVAAGLLEEMALPLPATGSATFALNALEPALGFAQDKGAVALGPGLSRHPETTAFVHGFVQRCPVPFLVDADALNALSEHPAMLDERVSSCVLTPHPGEMSRLTGQPVLEILSARQEIAAEFAKVHGCVVVLKGRRTVVANATGPCHVNTTGGPGLATGGTGDVLTGIIGSLLAQGLAPVDAARLGVFVHGLAGDLAAAEKTARGMVAGDVVEALPQAWRVLEGNCGAPAGPE